MFLCEFCENFKKTFFTERLLETASGISCKIFVAIGNGNSLQVLYNTVDHRPASLLRKDSISAVFASLCKFSKVFFCFFCRLSPGNLFWIEVAFVNTTMNHLIFLNTAQKMKFSIKDFFSKYDQIRRKLRIWSHLLKKSLTENFIFCAREVIQFELHFLRRNQAKKITYF